MLKQLLRRLRSGKGMNPTRMVALSFACIILIGGLLLMLPVSSRSGEVTGPMTAFFTATSATCVTGLILVDTWQNWSLFGQGVILLLIQLGGLGFMTMITLVSLVLRRRIGLSERLLMTSTLNLKDMDGVVRVVRHALQGTFLMEAVGAVILSACFIPAFGVAEGIWRGIFHSVSAFCNAGFDLLGVDTPFTSLTAYSSHPVVLFTIMALITIGGLGFFVWEDILVNRKWRSFSLYTRIVLTMSALLTLGGAIFFFFVEYHGALEGMSLWEKGLNALFQSVTLRTAGFNTIDQAALSDASQLFSIILMLIGGSSGSTAGGLKTATIAILLLSLRAGMRGDEEVTLRKRTISHQHIVSAFTLVLTVVVLFLFSTIALSLLNDIPVLLAAFEVGSAMGTVGVTAGVTTSLNDISRMLVMLLMYSGRVGVLSFSIAFLNRKKASSKIKYPTIDIMIG